MLEFAGEIICDFIPICLDIVEHLLVSCFNACVLQDNNQFMLCYIPQLLSRYNSYYHDVCNILWFIDLICNYLSLFMYVQDGPKMAQFFGTP